jgi:hypothetical protein
MTDLTHLDAIQARLHRERARLAAATTQKDRTFRTVQIAQAEKEMAAEMKFLGIEDAPQSDMTDDDLLAALGV